jgi:PKD repeat protein
VYTLTVTVTDKLGATGSGRRAVTVVANQPPAASINGPYSSAEGTTITFSSDGSTDPNEDELSYKWTFGDGTTSTAASPTHAYADNGTYVVTLRVTDPSGATGTAATTANITNVAPGRQLLAPSAIFEGSDYTITLSGSDPGAKDRASLEYALDCGLGEGYSAWSTIVKSITCPVQLDQRAVPITVRGKVRDKDGAESEYVHDIEVRNAAPKVTFAATTATTVKAGDAVSFQAAFTDAGINDGTWAWRIVWGDNTTSAKGDAAAQGDLGPSMHTYARPGVYTAYVNVRDKDGSDQSSRQIAITVTQ